MNASTRTPNYFRAAAARLALPVLGLGILALVAQLHAARPGAYHTYMYVMTKLTAPSPFADWAWMPTAVRCWSQGVDVYVNNTCYDIWPNLAFNYSPIWLRFRFLMPLEPYAIPAGIALAATFIVSLAALPRSVGLAERICALLALLSSSAVLAMERGNADLIIFIFVVACLNLRRFPLPVRLAGYSLIVLAGLLKFYPFVALLIVLRERPKVVFGVALGAASALGALILAYRDEFAAMARNLPEPSHFTMQIGAANLPFGLGVTLTHALRRHFEIAPDAARQFGDLAAAALWPMLALAAIAAGVALARRQGLPRALAGLSAAQADFLVVGSLLLCGCFFAGQSVIYRGIYVLAMFPGLAALRRAAPTQAGRSVWTTTLIALVFVVWTPSLEFALIFITGKVETIAYRSTAFPGFTAGYFLWLATEIAWWWIAAVELAIIMSFVVRAELWILLSRRLAALRPPATPALAKIEAHRTAQ